MVLKLLSIYLCLFFLVSCTSSPKSVDLLPAKVIRVLSGQTVEVRLTETSQVAKVRITGIDAPDFRQSPWGKTAHKRLKELITGLPITIETDSLEDDYEVSQRDRFNRIHAHIWQDKTLISQQLVQEGYVLANTAYPHSYSKLLIDAQEYARLMGYGIWNPKQALRQTPNQFRSKIK